VSYLFIAIVWVNHLRGGVKDGCEICRARLDAGPISASSSFISYRGRAGES
jgi:hypothetical protein